MLKGRAVDSRSESTDKFKLENSVEGFIAATIEAVPKLEIQAFLSSLVKLRRDKTNQSFNLAGHFYFAGQEKLIDLSKLKQFMENEWVVGIFLALGWVGENVAVFLDWHQRLLKKEIAGQGKLGFSQSLADVCLQLANKIVDVHEALRKAVITSNNEQDFWQAYNKSGFSVYDQQHTESVAHQQRQAFESLDEHSKESLLNIIVSLLNAELMFDENPDDINQLRRIINLARQRLHQRDPFSDMSQQFYADVSGIVNETNFSVMFDAYAFQLARWYDKLVFRDDAPFQVARIVDGLRKIIAACKSSHAVELSRDLDEFAGKTFTSASTRVAALMQLMYRPYYRHYLGQGDQQLAIGVDQLAQQFFGLSFSFYRSVNLGVMCANESIYCSMLFPLLFLQQLEQAQADLQVFFKKNAKSITSSRQESIDIRMFLALKESCHGWMSDKALTDEFRAVAFVVFRHGYGVGFLWDLFKPLDLKLKPVNFLDAKARLFAQRAQYFEKMQKLIALEKIRAAFYEGKLPEMSKKMLTELEVYHLSPLTQPQASLPPVPVTPVKTPPPQLDDWIEQLEEPELRAALMLLMVKRTSLTSGFLASSQGPGKIEPDERRLMRDLFGLRSCVPTHGRASGRFNLPKLDQLPLSTKREQPVEGGFVRQRADSDPGKVPFRFFDETASLTRSTDEVPPSGSPGFGFKPVDQVE